MDAVVEATSEAKPETEASRFRASAKSGWTAERKAAQAERLRAVKEAKRLAEAVASEVEPLLEGGPDDHLEAMRHVCSKGAYLDRTPLQKSCRVWMTDTPGTFAQAKTRLEEAAAKAPRKTAAAEVEGGEDVGERVCLELLDRFLEGGDGDGVFCGGTEGSTDTHEGSGGAGALSTDDARGDGDAGD